MEAKRQTETTRLDELASEINRLHDAAVSAVRTALQNAIRAGELLDSAKSLVPHGSWYGWLRDHTDVGVRQAQRYMKLYRERDTINASSATHLSSALEIVSTPKSNVTHLSTENAAGNGRAYAGNGSARQMGEASAAAIADAQVSSEAVKYDDGPERDVDEHPEQPARAYSMEDLMSVDGLYSLVCVWNSINPDARRKFIELVDGDVSDIRIER